jgi:hypothetical protein
MVDLYFFREIKVMYIFQQMSRKFFCQAENSDGICDLEFSQGGILSNSGFRQ